MGPELRAAFQLSPQPWHLGRFPPCRLPGRGGPEPQPSSSHRLSRRRWQVRWTAGRPRGPSFPSEETLSALPVAPAAPGRSEEAWARLPGAAPQAAWPAADSFVAFTGNGIRSLLSYQHGSLASCRKGDSLAGAGVEPEGQAQWPGAALFRPPRFLRDPQATSFDLLLWFFPPSLAF